MREEWRTIPGYGGFYEINKHGEIRSWRVRGGLHARDERADKPTMLRPYLHRKKKAADALEICLHGGDGKRVPLNVKHLVRDIWMQGKIPGMHLKFVDGDPTHCDVNNLRYMPMAKINGMRHMSNRKPVVKCSIYHEKLEFYRNATEAARKNNLSDSGMRNRIKRKTVIDGVYFRFDD